MTALRDMTIEEFCDVHSACDEGREWALTHCTTMQECWEKMTDPGWIAWVASRPGVLADWQQREFALFCCELVRPQLTDFRSLATISILRLWQDCAGVPIIVDVVNYVERAGGDLDRLVNWLHTHTKPNFIKKEG